MRNFYFILLSFISFVAFAASTEENITPNKISTGGEQDGIKHPEMMNVNRLMHSSLRHFDGEMNMNRPIRGLQRTMAFEEDNGMRRNRYPSGIYVPRRRSPEDEITRMKHARLADVVSSRASENMETEKRPTFRTRQEVDMMEKIKPEISKKVEVMDVDEPERVIEKPKETVKVVDEEEEKPEVKPKVVDEEEEKPEVKSRVVEEEEEKPEVKPKKEEEKPEEKKEEEEEKPEVKPKEEEEKEKPEVKSKEEEEEKPKEKKEEEEKPEVKLKEEEEEEDKPEEKKEEEEKPEVKPKEKEEEEEKPEVKSKEEEEEEKPKEKEEEEEKEEKPEVKKEEEEEKPVVKKEEEEEEKPEVKPKEEEEEKPRDINESDHEVPIKERYRGKARSRWARNSLLKKHRLILTPNRKYPESLRRKKIGHSEKAVMKEEEVPITRVELKAEEKKEEEPTEEKKVEEPVEEKKVEEPVEEKKKEEEPVEETKVEEPTVEETKVEEKPVEEEKVEEKPVEEEKVEEKPVEEEKVEEPVEEKKEEEQAEEEKKVEEEEKPEKKVESEEEKKEEEEPVEEEKKVAEEPSEEKKEEEPVEEKKEEPVEKKEEETAEVKKVEPAAIEEKKEEPAPKEPVLKISLYSVKENEAMIRAESSVATRVWCTALLSFQSLHRDQVMSTQPGVMVEKPTAILIPGLYGNQQYTAYCFTSLSEPVHLSFVTVKPFFKLLDTRVQNSKLSTVILATASSTVVCKVIDNSEVKEVIKVHFDVFTGRREYKKITFSKPVRRSSSLSCVLLDFQDNPDIVINVETLPFKHSLLTIIVVIVIVIIVGLFIALLMVKRMNSDYDDQQALDLESASLIRHAQSENHDQEDTH